SLSACAGGAGLFAPRQRAHRHRGGARRKGVPADRLAPRSRSRDPAARRLLPHPGARRAVPVDTELAARTELDWWQARREAVPPQTYGRTIARVATLL